MDDVFSRIFKGLFPYDEERRKRQEEEIIKNAYGQASGIDIEEQRRIWDERAKGYWGEYKVFSVLFRMLDFPNKIMVNVQIPAANGRTTEIDVILFAPTGVYVFEVKHYSGAVYGGYDSPTWTEYYKTRDSVTFENPLKQNEYHLRQLKSLLPDARLSSYVVFTNPDANIRVGGRYPGYLTVTQIEDLEEKLRSDFADREEVYSSEQIEKFYGTIRPYCPLETKEQEFFTKEEKFLPFSEFAEAMLLDLEREKKIARDEANRELKRKTEVLENERGNVRALESHYRALIKTAEEERDRAISAANEERDKAIDSLNELAKNFEVVTPFSSGYGVINRDCFKAEVTFERSESFLNTTNMYFTLINLSKELWIDTARAWFILGLKNGTVQKYILSEHIHGFRIGSVIDPGRKRHASPCKIRLFNVEVEDINYIKLCNTFVTDRPNGGTCVAPGVEFEIYVSEDTDTVYKTEDVIPIAGMNDGAFELSPEFMKSEFVVNSAASGTGCDVSFSFSAGTPEVGFELVNGALLIGTKTGQLAEYGIKKNTKNFYSTTVMPLSKTNKYIMHLNDIQEEDVAFIKLKGIRVFRKEYWQRDDILPGVEFDVYPKEIPTDESL